MLMWTYDAFEAFHDFCVLHCTSLMCTWCVQFKYNAF